MRFDPIIYFDIMNITLGGFALSRFINCNQVLKGPFREERPFLLIVFWEAAMQDSCSCIFVHSPKRNNAPEKLFTIFDLFYDYLYSIPANNRNEFVIRYHFINFISPIVYPHPFKFLGL